MGLWIIQECQREWERRGKKLSFAEIVKEAEKEPAFRSLFDPDDDVSWRRPAICPARLPIIAAARVSRFRNHWADGTGGL